MVAITQAPRQPCGPGLADERIVKALLRRGLLFRLLRLRLLRGDSQATLFASSAVRARCLRVRRPHRLPGAHQDTGQEHDDDCPVAANPTLCRRTVF